LYCGIGRRENRKRNIINDTGYARELKKHGAIDACTYVMRRSARSVPDRKGNKGRVKKKRKGRLSLREKGVLCPRQDPERKAIFGIG